MLIHGALVHSSNRHGECNVHMSQVQHASLVDAGAEPRVYTQVSDSARMLTVLKEYLSDYNAISKKPMQLVLFQFALEHISRICRIITSPGNALML